MVNRIMFYSILFRQCVTCKVKHIFDRSQTLTLKVSMKVFFCVYLFLGWCIVQAQDYSYTHYDTHNGLPGLNVYNIYQDREGFMWFATDGGLCRYDGSNYKTFTVANGLPDNEIIGIYQDSKKRIWMLPFKNQVCYYLNGKFFTAANDTLLHKINIHERAYGATEDTAGNIWFFEQNMVYKISTEGKVFSYKEFNGIAVRNCAKISSAKDGGILLLMSKGVYHLKDDYLKLVYKSDGDDSAEGSPLRHVGLSPDMCIYPKNGYRAQSLHNDSTFLINFVSGLNNNVCVINEQMFVVCTTNGAYLYNFADPSQRGQKFLGDKNIGYAYGDNEGNLWFAAMGEGVYKLSSLDVRTFTFSQVTGGSSEVSSINKRGSEYLLGTRGNRVITTSDFLNVSSFRTCDDGYPGKIKFITQQPDKDWLIVDDFSIERLDNNFKQKDYKSIGIKSVYDPPGNEIVVATATNVIIMNEDAFDEFRVVWNERGTAVFVNAYGDLYIGTLGGLHFLSNGKAPEFLGAHEPLLQHRISTMCQMEDGTMLVGTYGHGLIILHNHQVRFHITEKNGLSNDIINSITADGNDIWVGTNKGLNRISLQKNNYNISQFTTADGLVSNMITSFLLVGDTALVGTFGGLNIFNKSKIQRESQCNLRVLQVLINGQEVPLQSAYSIEPDEEDFKVEFTAISFKSEGNIRYKYRLKGLFNDWRVSNQNVLQLASLPFGQYQLELIAINKFGIVSEPVEIILHVPKPYYKNTLFIVSATILFTSLILGLTYRREKRRRLRLREQEIMHNKVIQLEQYALQAQMNPHFIFNCLSSLQHYLYENNVKEGNRLLTKFASLIRQTLDNSSQLYISLDDEIKYLNNYLEVEQIRFDYEFNFKITVAPAIETSKVNIPNMVMQPFVENSIKHGIRYRKNGKIEIFFEYVNNLLVCKIKDNGVGRKKSLEYKTANTVSHESKGLSLTAKRIDLLNSISSSNISMHIEDLYNQDGEGAGTLVTIRISN